MFKKKKPKLLDSTPASESLQKIGLKSKSGKTKISEILEDFHENGILLAMIFFTKTFNARLGEPDNFLAALDPAPGI